MTKYSFLCFYHPAEHRVAARCFLRIKIQDIWTAQTARPANGQASVQADRLRYDPFILILDRPLGQLCIDEGCLGVLMT